MSLRLRHHYLPVADIQAGMILGETVQVIERGILSMVLPAGLALTEDHLNQLNAHHAEFICVDLPDQRTEEQIAADAAQAAHRVREIFRDGDLSDPLLLALFDQVLAYRSE